MKTKQSNKRVYHFILVLFLTGIIPLIPSCSEKDSINDQNKVSLISPNGTFILEDMKTLERVIESDIIKKDGVLTEYELKDIEYVNGLAIGASATVFYDMKNGTRRSFILSRDVAFNIKSKTIKTYLSESKVQTIVKITCTASGPCSAEECFSQAVYDIEAGTMTYQCECADCILEVETID